VITLTRKFANSLCAVIGICLSGLVVAGTTATPREAAVNGVWTLAKPAARMLVDASGKSPPLNAEGKKLYDERKAKLAKSDLSYDLSQKCKPIGFPRSLWDGSPFDIQVQPDLVFMGFTWNRNHRMVNFSSKPPNLQVPRYYGTGSARWDGDTLVIDSGLYNTNSILDSAGLPFSEDMLLVERYKPTNGGKSLEVQLTITDAQYYSKPWTVKTVFNKVASGRILEDVCQERSEFYKPLLKGR
jgi:hypothetical protein